MNTPLQLIDLREAAMLDYYVSAFWWGREHEFTIEQLSAFFTVIHTLLNNIKGKANPSLNGSGVLRINIFIGRMNAKVIWYV